jgi:plasmid stability protein
MEVLIVAQVLVRDLSPDTIESLKKRAEKNRRSLQGELKVILEEAARELTPIGISEFLARARAIRERTAGRVKTDSAELIRKDRGR